MTNQQSNKELVKAGHAFAAAMSMDTPIIVIAKMVTELAIDYREPGDKWYGEHVFSMRNQSGTWCDYTKEQFLAKCPLGAVGERLWVRENFFEHGHWQGGGYDREDSYFVSDKQVLYPADGVKRPAQRAREDFWRSRPSIHMPRWASRITLEITGVRVERLTALSDDDARNEGCPAQLPDNPEDEHQARTWFRGLWSELYGEESWSDNPYVWVINFRRVQ
ncbi:hypothetical protein IBT49_04535 [Erwinia sp. S63]|uniref:hypothetical protein n=1 Tax=Erwinia sp. S63 TaxID=2769341 RepID=UPI00190CD434|nr:hypothetical protein [Erwinia sp. S63]MBK0095231.1 hypothetical protein [Erwinia sp. S63]